MPPPETMFCAQQIKIPPELPDILKQFTKAAIRTQPHDILQWAAAYFSALSKGEPLPVKERFEMPLPTEETDGGLTPGLLKILHKQFSPKGRVNVAELKEKWKHLCLPEEQLNTILQLDSFGEEAEWMKILALGCSVLGKTLLSSMKHACEIITRDPEGGAASVPFETFSFLYSYLASIDGEIPEEKTEAFLQRIKEQALVVLKTSGHLHFMMINRRPTNRHGAAQKLSDLALNTASFDQAHSSAPETTKRQHIGGCSKTGEIPSTGKPKPGANGVPSSGNSLEQKKVL